MKRGGENIPKNVTVNYFIRIIHSVFSSKLTEALAISSASLFHIHAE